MNSKILKQNTNENVTFLSVSKDFENELQRLNSMVSAVPAPRDVEYLDYDPNQSNIGKLQYYLSKRYDFRKNEISGFKEFKVKAQAEFRKLTDYDVKSLWREVNTKGEMECALSQVENLLDSDFAEKFNPLTSYFNTLPSWDGQIDYIQELANTVCTTNTEFWNDCFKRWIVGIVATVLDSDAANHTVLVLSGSQGIGKTKWLTALVPKELKAYSYSGHVNPKDKDTLAHLCQCLIVNIDEIDCLRHGDLNLLKDTITKESIRYRKPYAKEADNYNRYASFAATVNSTQFLTDTTGNRRFLCNQTLEINYKHHIELDKVYSQAVALYRAGYKYWFDPEEIQLIAEQNSQFEQVSAEEEYIQQLFEPCSSADAQCQYLNASGIAKFIADYFKTPLSNNVIIGKTMSKLGFEKVKQAGIWKYRVRTKDAEADEAGN